jgi:mycothiol synthase
MDAFRSKADTLILRRPTLDRLPPVRVPAGYALRPFRAGDEVAWEDLLAAAFPDHPGAREVPRTEFLWDPLWRPDRTVFAWAGDTLVACCAAWETASIWGPHTGRIHWVATHPDHGRRGLARAVVTAALAWMKDYGYADAVLVTQTHRLPAIRLYLDLGFGPDVAAFPEMRGRWRKVEVALRERGRP